MNTRFGRMERLALQAALLEGPEGRQPLLELLNEVDFENARSGIWRLSPLLHARAVAYGVSHPVHGGDKTIHWNASVLLSVAE